MSQHDLVIDNGPGINVRLDINQALQSLGSMELGTSAPAPTYPCQRWADLTTGLLKKRNSANTAWLADGKLDVATGGGVPVGGATGAILTKNSAADGDMIWQSTVGFLPTTGGTITGNLVVRHSGYRQLLFFRRRRSTSRGRLCDPVRQRLGCAAILLGRSPSVNLVVDNRRRQRLTINRRNATFAKPDFSGNTNQINGTAMPPAPTSRCPASGALVLRALRWRPAMALGRQYGRRLLCPR